MLSIGAFNALLKTLEEPPEYVIFILATTEVHKIPITILSRCQHYDFKRISIETITERMQELMDTEHVEAEDKALRYIAKAADGSMRDALSLLDQCIAFYLGQKVNIRACFGSAGSGGYGCIQQTFAESDQYGCAGCARRCGGTRNAGKRSDCRLTADFTWYLRNLLLVKTSDNIEDVSGCVYGKYDAVKRRIRDDRDSSVIPVYPCFFRAFRAVKICDAKENHARGGFD